MNLPMFMAKKHLTFSLFWKMVFCIKSFMNDGLMTGIFLDQHEVRGSLVDGLAMGKSLLNMFSYTAAFSVAAAMGGSKPDYFG